MKFYTHRNINLPFQLFRRISLQYLIRCILAVVLAFSGIVKLIDVSGLLVTLQQVAYLSEEMIVLIATALPILELGVATALFLQWKSPITLVATCLLFTVSTWA